MPTHEENLADMLISLGERGLLGETSSAADSIANRLAGGGGDPADPWSQLFDAMQASEQGRAPMALGPPDEIAKRYGVAMGEGGGPFIPFVTGEQREAAMPLGGQRAGYPVAPIREGRPMDFVTAPEEGIVGPPEMSEDGGLWNVTIPGANGDKPRNLVFGSELDAKQYLRRMLEGNRRAETEAATAETEARKDKASRMFDPEEGLSAKEQVARSTETIDRMHAGWPEEADEGIKYLEEPEPQKEERPRFDIIGGIAAEYPIVSQMLKPFAERMAKPIEWQYRRQANQLLHELVEKEVAYRLGNGLYDEGDIKTMSVKERRGGGWFGWGAKIDESQYPQPDILRTKVKDQILAGQPLLSPDLEKEQIALYRTFQTAGVGHIPEAKGLMEKVAFHGSDWGLFFAELGVVGRVLRASPLGKLAGFKKFEAPASGALVTFTETGGDVKAAAATAGMFWGLGKLLPTPKLRPGTRVGASGEILPGLDYYAGFTGKQIGQKAVTEGFVFGTMTAGGTIYDGRELDLNEMLVAVVAGPIFFNTPLVGKYLFTRFGRSTTTAMEPFRHDFGTEKTYRFQAKSGNEPIILRMDETTLNASGKRVPKSAMRRAEVVGTGEPAESKIRRKSDEVVYQFATEQGAAIRLPAKKGSVVLEDGKIWPADARVRETVQGPGTLTPMTPKELAKQTPGRVVDKLIENVDHEVMSGNVVTETFARMGAIQRTAQGQGTKSERRAAQEYIDSLPDRFIELFNDGITTKNIVHVRGAKRALDGLVEASRSGRVKLTPKQQERLEFFQRHVAEVDLERAVAAGEKVSKGTSERDPGFGPKGSGPTPIPKAEKSKSRKVEKSKVESRKSPDLEPSTFVKGEKVSTPDGEGEMIGTSSQGERMAVKVGGRVRIYGVEQVKKIGGAPPAESGPSGAAVAPVSPPEPPQRVTEPPALGVPERVLSTPAPADPVRDVTKKAKVPEGKTLEPRAPRAEDRLTPAEIASLQAELAEAEGERVVDDRKVNRLRKLIKEAKTPQLDAVAIEDIKQTAKKVRELEETLAGSKRKLKATGLTSEDSDALTEQVARTGATLDKVGGRISDLYGVDGYKRLKEERTRLIAEEIKGITKEPPESDKPTLVIKPLRGGPETRIPIPPDAGAKTDASGEGSEVATQAGPNIPSDSETDKPRNLGKRGSLAWDSLRGRLRGGEGVEVVEAEFLKLYTAGIKMRPLPPEALTKMPAWGMDAYAAGVADSTLAPPPPSPGPATEPGHVLVWESRPDGSVIPKDELQPDYLELHWDELLDSIKATTDPPLLATDDKGGIIAYSDAWPQDATREIAQKETPAVGPQEAADAAPGRTGPDGPGVGSEPTAATPAAGGDKSDAQADQGVGSGTGAVSTPRKPARDPRRTPKAGDGGGVPQGGGSADAGTVSKPKKPRGKRTGIVAPGDAGTRLDSPTAGTGGGGAGSGVTIPSRDGPTHGTKSTGNDYQLTDATIAYLEEAGIGGVTRVRTNIAVIELLRNIRARGRPATPEEKDQLARYVGWGGWKNDVFQPKYGDKTFKGIKERLEELLSPEEYQEAFDSTPNAHYTTPSIVKAIYQAVAMTGFKGGRVLDPSTGSGMFLGAMPRAMAGASQRVAVELDSITAQIAKVLYEATDVRHVGYEEFRAPPNYFDLVISNVPFMGGTGPFHKTLNPRGLLSLHNFFFIKALHETRPGGLVVFVTTAGTLNSPNSTAVRKRIAEQAHFLGAVRLPETTFKRIANTEVVTDIVFLQKRGEGVQGGEIDWVESQPLIVKGKDGGETEFQISEYFLANLDQVVGEHSDAGTMYRGGSYTVTPPEGDLQQAIEAALAGITKATYTPRKRANRPTAVRKYVQDDDDIPIRRGEFGILDGEIYFREGDELIPLEQASPGKGGGVGLAKMKELMAIRDSARALLDLMRADREAPLEELQATLNEQYDAFLHRYRTKNAKGEETPSYINNRSNAALHRNDPTLATVETYNVVTKVGTKSGIFSRRVFDAQPRPTSAGSASEALAISLNEGGTIDIGRVAKLLGKSEDAATEALTDEALAYLDPASESLVPTDQYLSGADMYGKLDEARAAAELDPRFVVNVTALEAVIPKPVMLSGDKVRPGVAWIPDNIVHAWAKELFESNDEIEMKKSPSTGEWVMSSRSRGGFGFDIETQWGTESKSAATLLESALNGQRVVVYEAYTDDAGNKRRRLDEKETKAARNKVKRIVKHFSDWVAKSEHVGELTLQYNRQLNTAKKRYFDGSHLTFPGLAAGVEIHPYQKDEVWRLLASGHPTLLALPVGYGKTYIMVLAGMEAVRLGLTRKVMVVVPNHIIGQWQQKWLELYPNARIAAADNHISGNARDRKLFMGRVLGDEYEVLLINYSMFKQIGLGKDIVQGYFQRRIDELEAAIQEESGKRGEDTKRLVATMAKARLTLKSRLKQKLAKLDKQSVVTFDDLGVNYAFFDETHDQFRNLGFGSTKMGQNVKGLGKPDGSDMAFQAEMFSHYLHKLNGGRGLVFATATPLANTMAELYYLQRYLQPATLDALGIVNLDQWVANFADTPEKLEMTVAMTMKEMVRLSEFRNFDRLSQIFQQFTAMPTVAAKKSIEDYLKRHGLRGLPKMALNEHGHRGWRTIQTPAAPGYPAFQEWLRVRYKNLKRAKKGGDNALVILTHGQWGTNHLPSVWKTDADEIAGFDDYKIMGAARTVADKLLREYPEKFDTPTTALIFMEHGVPDSKKGPEKQLYYLLRDRLIEEGFAPDEVKIVQENKGRETYPALMRDMKADKPRVRVLIGNVGSMSTGLNVQRWLKLVVLIEPPWNPSSVTQLLGRALRQGNEYEEVDPIRFVMKASNDAFMYQALENKANTEHRFFTGQMEDMGSFYEEDLSTVQAFDTAKAIAADDPRVLEHVQLSQRMKDLVMFREQYDQEQFAGTNRLARLPGIIEKKAAALVTSEGIGKVLAEKREDVPWVIGGKKYPVEEGSGGLAGRKEVGQAIIDQIDALPQAGKKDALTTTNIGQVTGMSLAAHNVEQRAKGLVEPAADDPLRKEGRAHREVLAPYYSGTLLNVATGEELGQWFSWGNPSDVVRAILKIPKDFQRFLVSERSRLASMEADLARALLREDEGFPEQAELDRVTADLAALESAMGLDRQSDVQANAPEEIDPDDVGEDPDDTAGGAGGAGLAPEKPGLPLRPELLSMEERRWAQRHPEQPTFGLGGRINLPETRSAWQRGIDEVTQRITNMKPGSNRRRAMDWFMKGFNPVHEWNVAPKTRKMFMRTKGRIGRAKMDAAKLVQQWDKLSKASRESMDTPKFWRRFEELMQGQPLVEGELSEAQVALLRTFEGLRREVDDSIEAKPYLKEDWSFYLRNMPEVMALNRGTYVRTLIDPPEERGGKKPRGVIDIGPRLIPGPLKPKRSTGLWTVTTPKGTWQFENEDKAHDFHETNIRKYAKKYGQSVTDKVRIEDPIPIEAMEKLPRETDPRVIMTRTIVDSVTNVEVLDLYYKLATTLGHEEDPGPGYKRMQDSGLMGRMRNLYMPDHVVDNIEQVRVQTSAVVNMLWDTPLAITKAGWVLYSPPTWTRALMSNQLILGPLAGINMVTDSKHYHRAVRAIAANHPDVIEMYDSGTMSGRYQTQIKEQLKKALQTLGPWTESWRASRWMTKAFLDSSEKLGNAYDLIDRTTKVALYYKARENWGMTKEEAMEHVYLHVQNYDRLGPFAEKIKRVPLGTPFFAFTASLVRVILSAVRNRPLLLLGAMLAPKIIDTFSRMWLGISDEEEELDAERYNRYFQPRLPWRNENGVPYTLDLRWIIPWGDMLRWDTWVGGQPLVGGLAEIALNRDSYSQRNITTPDMSVGEKLGARAAHLAKDINPLPSIVKYGIPRVVRAYRGESRESVFRAVASSVFGISIKDAWVSRRKAYDLIVEKINKEAGENYFKVLAEYNKRFAPSARQGRIQAGNVLRSARLKREIKAAK